MKHALPALLVLAPLASAQLQRVSATGADEPVPGRLVVETLRVETPEPPVGSAIGQMPGWPRTIPGNGTFAPVRGLVFCDLDGSGDREVVMSSTDGRLYAWHHDGTDVTGFPVNLKHASNIYAQSAPSVADLDADGDLEIVQFTRGLTSGGRLWILDHHGAPLPGFPLSSNDNNLSQSPTLKDLDDDGVLEILAQERDYPNTRLRVFELDGTQWGGNYPVTLDHVPTVTPAVADVDEDGAPEIVVASYDSIYVLEADGSVLPGWPQGIPNANFSYQSPALADLDDDGDLELVIGAHKDAAGVYAFHHDGAPVQGWPRLVGTWTYCPPTVTDLEEDGVLDVISGREGFGPGSPSSVFWVWDEAGNVRPGFPYVQSHGGGTAGPITVYDLEGDGTSEIFLGHNIMVNGQGFVFGVDAAGNDLPGFPLRPTGFTYQNGAVIEDVDGDGDVELGVVSFENANVHVNLYDLDEGWRPADAAWPVYHKTARRGGRAARGRALHVAGSSALGDTLQLTLVGTRGNPAHLWLGTQQAHTHTPYGWLHLQQPFRRTYHSGTPIPPAGQLTSSQKIPQVPALVGLTLFFQGLETWSGGGELSELSGVVIRP